MSELEVAREVERREVRGDLYRYGLVLLVSLGVAAYFGYQVYLRWGEFDQTFARDFVVAGAALAMAQLTGPLAWRRAWELRSLR
jgi:hypothetical protein